MLSERQLNICGESLVSSWARLDDARDAETAAAFQYMQTVGVCSDAGFTAGMGQQESDECASL
ncbi:MAG TPA: hypothetical protein DCE75_02760 [Acidimicrobiaceae bacterium]|nr:hypothetical protein [Acidimicrobiaceae bacterium]